MKIAWFTHRYHPVIGGSENYARAMVRRMVTDGHEVDVLTSDADDLARLTQRTGRSVDAERVSTVDGARVTRFAPRHVPFQRYVGKILGYAPYSTARCQFASYLPWLPGYTRVRGKYQLVFSIAFPYTNVSYAALKTARAARCPLVITPLLHLATPGDPVNRAYTQPHQRWLLRSADLVIAATNLEAEAIRSWGITSDRILTLPMAVERDDVTGGDSLRFRTSLGIRPDAPLIGQLGAHDLDKGTNDLVEAIRRLNKDSIRPPIQLVLAGRPTARFDAYLKSIGGEDFPWLHRVTHPTTDQCRDFYAAIDLFAMPSRTDSFGIVFLEAWANSKAVVAARAGGVADVIRSGEDGLLVPFGDPESLAAAFDRLLFADPELRQQMGRSGAHKVASGYTWDDRYRSLTDRTKLLVDDGHAPTLFAKDDERREASYLAGKNREASRSSD